MDLLDDQPKRELVESLMQLRKYVKDNKSLRSIDDNFNKLIKGRKDTLKEFYDEVVKQNVSFGEFVAQYALYGPAIQRDTERIEKSLKALRATLPISNPTMRFLDVQEQIDNDKRIFPETKAELKQDIQNAINKRLDALASLHHATNELSELISKDIMANVKILETGDFETKLNEVENLYDKYRAVSVEAEATLSDIIQSYSLKKL